MTQSFGFELLSLPQIFDDRMFRVPDYQRGFSWTDDQVKDLLKDLEHMRDGQDSEARHYTGTLVVIRGSESRRYDIVDGQQRLTTLIILMSCLVARPEMAELAPMLTERYIRRGDIGNERYVLQQGGDSQEFFERVILESSSETTNSPSIASHGNLLKARRTIAEWLEEHHANDESGLKTLLELSEKRLGFLVYEPKSSAEVGIMFEVINNRGRPLTELEKVKNYLIYLASKLNARRTQKRINDGWAGILQNLYRAKQAGEGGEHTFLRAAAVVFFKLSKNESSNIYFEIKNSCLNLDHIHSKEHDEIDRNKAIKLLEGFIKFLSDCSFWYRLLHDRETPTENLSADTCSVICRLRAQRQHANILPLVFSVLTKHRGSEDTRHSVNRLLELMEIVNFRVYLARNSWRSDWGQAPLYSIASRYWHDQSVAPYGLNWSDLEITLEQQLERRLVWFTIVRSGATDQQIENSLILADDDPYDFARWAGLRYFLISYEEFLNPKKTIDIDQILARRDTKKSGDFYSLEHIWASRHDGGRHKGRLDEWIRRRLGNFCLLELNLNIIGRDTGIERKIKLYSEGKPSEGVQKSELAQVDEVIRISRGEIESYGLVNLQDGRRVGYRTVHEAICNKRELTQRRFCLERWSLKNFEGYQDATDYHTDS